MAPLNNSFSGNEETAVMSHVSLPVLADSQNNMAEYESESVQKLFDDLNALFIEIPVIIPYQYEPLAKDAAERKRHRDWDSSDSSYEIDSERPLSPEPQGSAPNTVDNW